MRRREFIGLLGGAAAASWPRVSTAQQSVLPVVGFLRNSSPVNDAHLVAAFRRGLHEVGTSRARISELRPTLAWDGSDSDFVVGSCFQRGPANAPPINSGDTGTPTLDATHRR